MRDGLTFVGFVMLAVFGSALDSRGWAGWAAVAGVLVGLAMILYSIREGGKDDAGFYD